jgi:RNA polymerase sigma-70 factor, ECF subfamily
MADYAAATNQRVPEVNPKYVDQARLPFAKRSAPPLLRISSAVEAPRKPRRTTPVVAQGDYTGAQKLLISAIPNLRAFATSLSRNSSHADDLVQETLVKAWANLASFQMGTNMKAWLFTILRNTFFTELRKRKHEVEDADEEQAERMCELPRQQIHMEFADFKKAFASLGADHKEALLLVGAEGFSYVEAAEIIGVPVGTVKSRVNRARAVLAKLLGLDAEESFNPNAEFIGFI